MAIQSDAQDFADQDIRRKERRKGPRRVEDRRNAAIWALGEWVLQCQRRAFFLVDDQLTPIFLNRAARESVKSVDWLRLDERELVILDPDLEKQIKSDLPRLSKAQGTATVQLRSGRRALDVTRLPMSHSLSAVYAIGLAPSGSMNVKYEQLKKAFGLTTVQARVALLIYEGGDQVSAAKRLGVSVNTVKTHMRAIFTRIGVRSQRELIRKAGELVGGWGT